MKTSSAKAKGRKLQQLVCSKILTKFPELTQRDVQSRSSGANGTDVVLSEKAYNVFPFSVECKNRQDLKTLYGYYNQARSQGDGTPLLVLKMNNTDPLVVVDIDTFFNMLPPGPKPNG
jgi:hypothetical protein